MKPALTLGACRGHTLTTEESGSLPERSRTYYLLTDRILYLFCSSGDSRISAGAVYPEQHNLATLQHSPTFRVAAEACPPRTSLVPVPTNACVHLAAATASTTRSRERLYERTRETEDEYMRAYHAVSTSAGVVLDRSRHQIVVAAWAKHGRAKQRLESRS